MQNDELIARLEAATRPDRDLDAAIAPLAGLRLVEEGHPLGRCCYDQAGHGVPLPAFTASIDAALTLVSDGARFCLDRYWTGEVDHPVWSAHIAIGGTPENPLRVFEVYDRATPALAICIAALSKGLSPAPQSHGRRSWGCDLRAAV